MIVICMNCQRIVGCANEKGEIIDDCYHCPTKECKFQIKRGTAYVMEVIVTRFTDCLLHDSPHIGYKIGG